MMNIYKDLNSVGSKFGWIFITALFTVMSFAYNPTQSVNVTQTGTYGDAAPLTSYTDFSVADGLVYCAAGKEGIKIFNMSDNSVAEQLGVIPTEGYVTKVAVQGISAYVYDVVNGLSIYNISSPASPVLEGQCALTGNISSVVTNGNYLYVTDTDTGLKVFNVSDHSAPYLASYYQIDGYSKSLIINNNTAFVCCTTEGLYILDITTPETPALLKHMDFRGRVNDIVISGDNAYVAAGREGIVKLDISIPAEPVAQLTARIPGDADHIHLSGDRLMVSGGLDGVRIFDTSTLALISDPLNVYRGKGIITGMTADGNTLFLNDTVSGITALDITTPESYFLKSHSKSSYQDVIITNGLAYVLSTASIDVLDMSNSTQPSLISNIELSGLNNAMCLDDGYVYVASGENGLTVLDAGNPSTLTIAGDSDTPGCASGVAVDLPYAYVADGSAGVQILDVSRKNRMTISGNYLSEGNAYDIQLSGTTAFIAEGNAGVSVVDITNPENPVLISRFKPENKPLINITDIFLNNNTLYAADSLNGLWILNVTDPQSMDLTGYYETVSGASHVKISGDMAYLFGNLGGVGIVDISNPSHPLLSGIMSDFESVSDLVIENDILYTTSGVTNALSISHQEITQLTKTITLSTIGNGSASGGSAVSPGTWTEITATPSDGYIFDHWEGDFNGRTNPASIYVDVDMNITAVFIENTPLNVFVSAGNENGTVEILEEGPYFRGDEVHIVATPHESFAFSHWEGSIGGNCSEMTITLNSDLTLTGYFTGIYGLATSVTEGSGIVNPVNSHFYSENQSVNVYAYPQDGYVFAYWEGDLTGSDNPAKVIMDADKTVSAVFVANHNPKFDTVMFPEWTTVGETINFTAVATDEDGDPLTIVWDFGDEITAEGNNVTHTYSASGDFQVTVTVTDGNYGVDTIQADMPVKPLNTPPQITGVTFPAECEANELQSFSVSVMDNEDNPYTVTWDFGDGGRAEGLGVEHTYLVPGTYTLSITVFDSMGDGSQSTAQVVVIPQNLPPVVEVLNVPATGNVGVPIQCEVAANDPEGGTVYVNWDFGDGHISNNASVNHTYNTVGNYNVSVTLTDEAGKTTLRTSQISVSGQPPVIDSFIGPAIKKTHESVDFEVVAHDPNHEFIKYYWNFGDGTEQIITNNQFASHIYTEAGRYTIVLKVINESGAVSIMNRLMLILENTTPVINSVTIPENAVDDIYVDFVVDATDDDGDKPSIIWDLGDGTIESGAIVRHKYMNAGDYSVKVTVDDGIMEPVSAEGIVHVIEVDPPVIENIVMPLVVKRDTPFDFSFQVTDPNGYVLTYSYVFADVNTVVDTFPAESAVSNIGVTEVNYVFHDYGYRNLWLKVTNGIKSSISSDSIYVKGNEDDFVFIPDPVLKENLVNGYNSGYETIRHIPYDTNQDGEISYSEAESVTESLDLSFCANRMWEDNYWKIIYTRDLTGIEAFVNVESLDCSRNYSYFLPDLRFMDNLRHFDCSDNWFLNEIKLPMFLITLNMNNVSSRIPKEFPVTLIHLDCSNMRGGRDFPIFPDGLETLTFQGSGVEEIHSLPSNLKTLDLYNSPYLEEISALPESLEYIRLGGGNSRTPLEVIPNLSTLTKLERFSYVNGSLTTLEGIENCTNLKMLDVENNNLVELSDLSGLMELNYLNILQNKGIVLHGFPNTLQTLDLHSCELLSLPELRFMTELEKIDCSFNNLTTIPALPDNLKVLNCRYNNIEILDLSGLPLQLVHLDCENNNLTSFPMFADYPELESVRCEYNFFTEENCDELAPFTATLEKYHFEYSNQKNDVVLTCHYTNDLITESLEVLFDENNAPYSAVTTINAEIPDNILCHVRLTYMDGVYRKEIENREVELSPGQNILSFSLAEIEPEEAEIVLLLDVDSNREYIEKFEDNNNIGQLLSLDNSSASKIDMNLHCSMRSESDYYNQAVEFCTGENIILSVITEYVLEEDSKSIGIVNGGDLFLKVIDSDGNEVFVFSSKTPEDRVYDIHLPSQEFASGKYNAVFEVTDHTDIVRESFSFYIKDCVSNSTGKHIKSNKNTPIKVESLFRPYVFSSDIEFSNDTPVKGEKIQLKGIIHSDNPKGGEKYFWTVKCKSERAIISPKLTVNIDGQLTVYGDFIPCFNGDAIIELNILDPNCCPTKVDADSSISTQSEMILVDSQSASRKIHIKSEEDDPSIFYSVSFKAEDNGNLEGNPFQMVQEGYSTTKVYAVPKEGYVFDSWNSGSVLDNPLVVDNVQCDLEFTASFKPEYFNVEFVAESGGYILGNTTQRVPYRADCTAVTAVPIGEGVFNGWGVEYGITNPLIIRNVTSDLVIHANFEESVCITVPTQIVYTGDRKITVDSKTSDQVELNLSGQLIDVSGSPVSERQVEVTLKDSNSNLIDGFPVNVMTDTEGNLNLPVTIPINTYTVELSYSGEPCVYDPSLTSATILIFTQEGSITGGGFVIVNEERANFGFNATYKKDGDIDGSVEFQFQDRDIDLHSENIEYLAINQHKVWCKGTATVNREDGYYFEMYIEDNGEPGTDMDVFIFTIYKDYDTGNTIKILDSFGGLLTGGEIQVHK